MTWTNKRTNKQAIDENYFKLNILMASTATDAVVTTTVVTATAETIDNLNTLIFNRDSICNDNYNKILESFDLLIHSKFYKCAMKYVWNNEKSNNYAKQLEQSDNQNHYSLYDMCIVEYVRDHSSNAKRYLNELNEWLTVNHEKQINSVQSLIDSGLITKYALFIDDEDEKHFNQLFDVFKQLKVCNNDGKHYNKIYNEYEQISTNIALQNILITFRSIPNYIECKLHNLIKSLTNDEQTRILELIQKQPEEVKRIIWNNEFKKLSQSHRCSWDFNNIYDGLIDYITSTDDWHKKVLSIELDFGHVI